MRLDELTASIAKDKDSAIKQRASIEEEKRYELLPLFQNEVVSR